MHPLVARLSGHWVGLGPLSQCEAEKMSIFMTNFFSNKITFLVHTSSMLCKNKCVKWPWLGWLDSKRLGFKSSAAEEVIRGRAQEFLFCATRDYREERQAWLWWAKWWCKRRFYGHNPTFNGEGAFSPHILWPLRCWKSWDLMDL